MAMGRVEAISRSYQEGMDNTPTELVLIGMVVLIIFMVAGYFVSSYFKRRRFQKRQKQRLKEKTRQGM